VKVQLGGVPETLLWTLYHRSIEARRPDAILTDPRAVELVDEIDYRSPTASGAVRAGWFFGFLAPLAAKLTPLRRLLFTIQRRRF
jgi:O-methyltransferase involved in polyketide biosynthesis